MTQSWFTHCNFLITIIVEHHFKDSAEILVIFFSDFSFESPVYITRFSLCPLDVLIKYFLLILWVQEAKLCPTTSFLSISYTGFLSKS